MNGMEQSQTPYEAALIQNLRDAGCSLDTIEAFLGCWREEQEGEQISLLNNHRQQLLENLHKEEKCIDCLDYLLYQLRRRREPEQ